MEEEDDEDQLPKIAQQLNSGDLEEELKEEKYQEGLSAFNLEDMDETMLDQYMNEKGLMEQVREKQIKMELEAFKNKGDQSDDDKEKTQ